MSVWENSIITVQGGQGLHVHVMMVGQLWFKIIMEHYTMYQMIVKLFKTSSWYMYAPLVDAFTFVCGDS